MCGGSLYAMETKNDIASEQVFVFKHTSFIKAKIYFVEKNASIKKL